MIFSINSEYGEWYYNLFYQLSLTISFLLFLFYGYKKKYPLMTWTMIGFSGMIFLFMGSRLGAMSLEEFFHFTKTLQAPHALGQTDIIGILAAVCGILIAKKVLGFRKPTLDAYAFIIPAAIVVQRIGCIMAGCCFGFTTSSPLSIQYGPNHSVFDYQVKQGLISPVSEWTLSLFPIPLFIMSAALVTLVLVWYNKNRFSRPGSLLLFSLSALLSFRFIIEFLRDPVTNHAAGDVIFGLKEIQWMLLGCVSLFISILIVFETVNVKPERIKINYNFSTLKHFIWALLIVESIWLVKTLFEPKEILSILILLSISLIALIIRYTPVVLKAPLKIMPVVLLIFSAFWMGQTITKNYKGEKENTDTLVQNVKEIKRWITTGTVIGSPEGEYRKYSGDGCDQVLIEQEAHKGQFATGIWYEQSMLKAENKKAVYGVGLNYSQYKVNDLHSNFGEDNRQIGLSVGTYFGKDKEEYGFKFGAYVGTIRYISGGPNADMEKIGFFPITQFRIGSLEKAYIKVGVGDELVYGIYSSTYRAILGLNSKTLGTKHDQVLEAGIINSISSGGIAVYIGGRFSVGERLIITSDIKTGDPIFYGVGLGYQFD